MNPPEFPKTGRVAVVDYRPEWPAEFTELQTRLQAALGGLALRVDHIGSTSIPGLPAKDIIDAQVTVANLDDPHLTVAMSAAGFTARPDVICDLFVGLPEDSPELAKRYFREPPGTRRTNIHIRQQGRFNQRYPLLFRDYLRHDSDARQAYAQIKQRLALLFPESIDGYLYIKDPVMDLIYAAAEHWAAATGWQIEH